MIDWLGQLVDRSDYSSGGYSIARTSNELPTYMAKSENNYEKSNALWITNVVMYETPVQLCFIQQSIAENRLICILYNYILTMYLLCWHSMWYVQIFLHFSIFHETTHRLLGELDWSCSFILLATVRVCKWRSDFKTSTSWGPVLSSEIILIHPVLTQFLWNKMSLHNIVFTNKTYAWLGFLFHCIVTQIFILKCQFFYLDLKKRRFSNFNF